MLTLCIFLSFSNSCFSDKQSSRAGTKIDKAEDNEAPVANNKRSSTRKTRSDDKDEEKDEGFVISSSKKSDLPDDDPTRQSEIEIEDDMDDDLNTLVCCKGQEKVLGLKVSTLLLP